uniref:Uncharacterized protein n=1 Tax=Strigamia maritima TaxID=126957 RepID=T1JIT1_STRMM
MSMGPTGFGLILLIISNAIPADMTVFGSVPVIDEHSVKKKLLSQFCLNQQMLIEINDLQFAPCIQNLLIMVTLKSQLVRFVSPRKTKERRIE